MIWVGSLNSINPMLIKLYGENKMTNNRQIGRRAEKEVEKMLQDAGWIVWLVDNPKQWKKEQDIFGYFDICAKKGRYTKWIQVKSNKKPYGRVIRKYMDWGEKYCSPFETVEWWNRLKNKPKDKRWDTHLLYFQEDS